MKNRQINDELYAALVNEAEALKKNTGETPTRFGMLIVLCGWFHVTTREHIDLVEKLYADGFVNA